ncbi:arginine deiminase [Clostridium acetireducens DSM 10703]|jgi:arginine deiminase|uniref:Arginine deiminase n=1 Tax=Clostridium acetireducens DSM 10703 TaxID=1121290 RepID=A0A1E8EYB6_9CLOT|nr:arginine deiminase [Clostridium acetireducens]OFI05516.1 arginine deiminase [Clostridium acetireducens DSM 10703]
MDNMLGINVYSEIGNLKKVVLHKPGKELENLTPNNLERLLFDDIPFLEIAQREHYNFAKVLKENGVEILYIENLAASAIKSNEVKNEFLEDIIKKSHIKSKNVAYLIKEYLLSMPDKAIIDKLIAGIRKKDLNIKEELEEYPFIMEPMPNLYFQRDPFASIGKGISLNSMRHESRKRESIFAKYIFKYHTNFKNLNIPKWYDEFEKYNIEGGDELVLSEELLAIGNTERTDKEAILKIANNIFGKDNFKTILCFEIPKIRAFMHLDTVLTMLDYDKFIIHNEIEKSLKITSISYDKENKKLNIIEESNNIEKVLSKYLNRPVTIIKCGGGDKIISSREQWNDGANTLALSPGKVITYERNYTTNDILDKHNIEVIPIASSELSRGRGGPRCMSMPLFRENLEY